MDYHITMHPTMMHLAIVYFHHAITTAGNQSRKKTNTYFLQQKINFTFLFIPKTPKRIPQLRKVNVG